MILTATQTPKKFAQVFPVSTRISIQVKPQPQGLADPIIAIAREQGEITNTQDALTLDAAATYPPAQPYSDWWIGELWYRSETSTPTEFVLEILTT